MTDNPFDQSNSDDLAGDGSIIGEPKLEVVPPSALEALNRAEVDVAIATAKRWKRDVAGSIKTCTELALRNQQIAKTCNYAVPRGGKIMVGPSVHFARLVAYSWGNATALSRVVACDRANAHLQGVFHDLQTNLRIGIEMDWPVQAPHKDSPERWADQMNLAKRAGGAVALRVAIFNVIPLVLFSDIAERAKLVAIGEGKSFEQSRAAAITAFKELGVSQAQIYEYLDRGGLESITTDDLILLHGVLVSIQERSMTVGEIFKPKGSVKPEVPHADRPPAEPRPTRLRKRATQAPAPAPANAPPPAPAPAAPPAVAAAAPQPAPAPAAAPAQLTLADQARERLLKGGFTEDEFLTVLDDFDLNRTRGKTLETVPQEDLAVVLSDWDSIVEQINARREQQELPMG